MPIPLLYRGLFGLFDIALPLFGIYGHLFAADSLILPAFAVSPVWPPAPEMRVMLDGGAGWHALLVTLQLVAQTKRSSDLLLWRTLQVGLLCVDGFMLLGFARALALEPEPRAWYNTAAWRGEDYGNFVGYATIAAIRTAFLLGVGLGNGNGGPSKKPTSKQT